MAHPRGFEPLTPWFVARYSIQLSYGCVAGTFGAKPGRPATPKKWILPDSRIIAAATAQGAGGAAIQALFQSTNAADSLKRISEQAGGNIMRIGAPKETKNQEYRAGLTVESVAALIADGHEVWVETGIGGGIGESDADYREAGARIAGGPAELFDRAELIVKVKEPNRQERQLLRPRHTLFCYLHLASDPEQAEDLLASDAVCIAFETITDESGALPLLTPMSEIAGRMAVQAATHFLQKRNGGRGILLSGATGVEPGKVAVIGGGVVGGNAARIALGLGARVAIIEKFPARRAQLREQLGPDVELLDSTPENIEAKAREADLVVGALLVPGGKVKHLIPETLVKKMQPGSVLADVCIDQGGCAETSRPTSHDDPVFIKHGVVHYCVANIPGAAPLTSTIALNRAILPYIRELADKGARRALDENIHLRRGLNICRGHITYQAVAEGLGLEHLGADEALPLI